MMYIELYMYITIDIDQFLLANISIKSLINRFYQIIPALVLFLVNAFSKSFNCIILTPNNTKYRGIKF